MSFHSFIVATLVNCSWDPGTGNNLSLDNETAKKTAEQTSTQEVSKENGNFFFLLYICIYIYIKCY